MDEEERVARARLFGAVADAYAAHRPGYPDEAVTWLAGTNPGRVLELGAGTGKLTVSLLTLGHDVVATDPSPQMLDRLADTAPEAHRVIARAEEVPLPSSSVDLVVAGQAYHWFDLERALPEVARVLRPGGVLGMIWNRADLKVPWVRRMHTMLGSTEPEQESDPVEGTELFTPSEHRVFRHWQQLDREGLVGLAASHSFAAGLTEPERAALLDRVGDLYDSYGRGPDGMLLPWHTHAYRSRVAGLASSPNRDDQLGDLSDDLIIDFP